ncbi:MAG: O-antigen ligase family protein [Actinomycetota bacterium]
MGERPRTRGLTMEATTTRLGTTPDRRQRLLPPGWAFYALFLGTPIWWALGLAGFIWPILAIPMLISLMLKRDIVLPRGFWIWLLFLLWVFTSAAAIDRGSAWFTYLYRLSTYLSATVVFVYVLNARRELPIRNVAYTLAAYWMYVVVFGYAALAAPHASFASLLEIVMRKLGLGSLIANPLLFNLVHPRLSQVQVFLGYASPRPTAPFLYTNNWGSAFALLIPFVIASIAISRRQLYKRGLVVALLFSLVPLVWSVDRGAWISLGAGLTYALVRFALRQNARAVLIATWVAAIVVTLIFASPLQKIISDRLAHPHSNEGRALLYQNATDQISQSPIIGFGVPLPPPHNKLLPNVGTQGQFWLVMVSTGIPGLVFFLWWWCYAFWRSRGGGTPIRFWANVTLIMLFYQMWVYGFLPAQIHILMIAAALAWRETIPPPEGSEGAALPNTRYAVPVG